MEQKQQSPALAGGPGFGNTSRTDDSTEKAAKQPGSKTKLASVLRVFLGRGSRGLTCFEAVPLAHDYVLRSTVSALSRQYGIEFLRSWEQIPGHTGGLVECIRYRLTPDGVARARKLLGLPVDPSAVEVTA